MIPPTPAKKPNPATVTPCSTRMSAAVGAMPNHRVSNGVTADPPAEAIHATATTGPVMAAAASFPPTTSAKRTGVRLSKVTMPKPQNSSTLTRASRTLDRRSSPTPSAIVRGTAATDRAKPRIPTVGRRSVMSKAVDTRLAT